MYDLQDWAAVQRVYKQTRSKRATAKILGMSRNTVRSLLEEKETSVYKRPVYNSKIDDFKEQIRSSNGDANRFFSMEHGFLEN